MRFARCHDEGLWRCMCNLLELPCDCAPPVIKRHLLGGLGLRSATRTREPAFWASWADALHMIHQRHPTIAVEVMDGLVHVGGSPSLTEARNAANNLRGCARGCEPPSPPHQLDEHEPRGVRGWQHEAASRVEVDHKNRHVFPVLTQTEKALLRAQSGPAAGVAFSMMFHAVSSRGSKLICSGPSCSAVSTFPCHPCPRLCRCGRPLDSYGLHRAACSRAGVGRRGIAVKSAAARICREAVTPNVLMRDLDVGVPVADTRRLEGGGRRSAPVWWHAAGR